MRSAPAVFLSFAVVLGGCTAGAMPEPPPTPSLPPMVWGVYLDNDVGAIEFAAWAFATPANTRGNPIDAARAVIALEYLSGELVANPRWVRIDSNVKFRMRQARDQVREVLGIRPDAPPQVVVDALMAVIQDLQAGNPSVAGAVLTEPLFTKGPQGTFDLLTNLPYVQQANLATSRVAAQALGPGGLAG